MSLIRHAASLSSLLYSRLNSLKKFYFIIDTLRSVHLQSPSTVETTWSVCVGARSEYDFRTLCDSLVLGETPLPPHLPTRDYLLVLLNIISDANVLFCAVGPLTSSGTSVRKASKLTNWWSPAEPEAIQLTQPNSPSESIYDDYSQYVALTADHEYNRVQEKLTRALEVWQNSFSARSPQQSDDDGGVEASSVWPLFHFARLLLEAGPAVYALPSFAKYMPEEDGNPLPGARPPCAPCTNGLRIPSSTLPVVMELLESVEHDFAGPRSTNDQQGRSACRPMWYPLVLFYGALVAWSHMCEEEKSAGKHQQPSRPSHCCRLTTRKLLQTAASGLAKVQEDWECARRMSAVISNLIQ